MSKTHEIIDKLEKAFQERLSLLQEHQITIDGLAGEFEGIEFTSFAPSPTGREFDLCFSGKQSDLLKVWGALRRRGFVPDVRPTKRESYVSTWFRKEGSSLQFWVYFSSKECRAVKVGVKMVEQTIYEVQCDSELAELGV